jgi:transcriptional regulator GlxA family with amidase domain
MKFGFLLFPDVAELDFVGPWEWLGHWRRVSPDAPEGVIVAERAGRVACVHGLAVEAPFSLRECPPLDYLLVPGGFGARKEVDNPAIIDFIAERARAARAVLSVCTGAFLLHRAGVLSGKRATTHWTVLDELRALGGVEVVEERFVQDGNLWTSAGVSAGLDLMLAFISATAGDGVASQVQATAEYFPSGKVYGDFPRHPKAPAYLRTSSRALPLVG